MVLNSNLGRYEGKGDEMINREIKFRAWHKKDKIMWFPTMIEIGDLLDNAVYSYPKGNIVPHYPNECILMQHTGLKDKNGVEIYEGDIVRDNNTIEVVVYQAPSFVMKKPIKRGFSKRWSMFVRCPKYNQFEEVIGNIYENPELLDG